MNEEARRILGELIVNPKYGRSLGNDPHRCEGLLRDLCGQYPREISALVSAVREKIPGELLSSQNSTGSEELLIQLTKRLQNNLALDEKAARWAVESWALALGVISSDTLRYIQEQQTNRQEITELTTKRYQKEQQQYEAVELERKAAERQLAEEKQRREEAERRLELERQTKKKDGFKAVIITSIIGAFILVSLGLGLALSQPLAAFLKSLKPSGTSGSSPSPSDIKPTAITTQPSPSPSPISNPPFTPTPISSPSPQPRAPSPSMQTNAMQTNATIVGKPGYKNIRSGPGTNYSKKHIAYPGDRVKVIESIRNSDNFPWYKIYFPESGAEGWIAGNLLAIDGQAPYQPQPQPEPSYQPPIQQQTNATVGGITGIKNLRSGPGTVYRVVGTASTGERVQILGSSYDKGGYQWYKVYHPESATTGWIAAQLINAD